MPELQLYAIINDGRQWVDHLVWSMIGVRFPACKFVSSIDELPSSALPVLQFSDGVRFSFEHVNRPSSDLFIKCL
jgi:hypothetical protein